MDETEHTQPVQAGSEPSFVEMLQGGDSHSPDVKENDMATQPAGDAFITSPEDGNATPTDSTAENTKGDNAENGTIGKDEYAELEERLQRTSKRLHDTQARLHEVCTERANLRKELDELSAKSGDDDGEDWFGDGGTNEKKDELEKKLAESDERLRQLDNESAKETENASYEAWEAKANAFSRKHSDFDSVVYQFLWGKLDPNSETFDPAVRSAWNKAPAESRTPEGVYKFATDLKERIEALDNPKAYRERVRAEVLNEQRSLYGSAPIGSEGLELVNSSSSAPAPQQEGANFVEALFR